MHMKWQPDLPLNRRRACMALLALFWCAGLLTGVHSGTKAGDFFFSLMRMASQSPASIVSLLAVTFLPFLFTAAAVFFSKPWLMLPILFCKGVSFGVCAYGICAAYGDAGWLARLFLLFSDGCTIPLLFWFCLQHLDGGKRAVGRNLAVCAAAVVLVGIADNCFISPFLAALTEI